MRMSGEQRDNLQVSGKKKRPCTRFRNQNSFLLQVIMGSN